MKRISYLVLIGVFFLIFYIPVDVKAKPRVLKIYNRFDDGSKKPGSLSYVMEYIHKFPGKYIIDFEVDVIVNATPNNILYLFPIHSPITVEFRGHGHNIYVYNLFWSKPSGCDYDKIAIRVNIEISSSENSVVKVRDLNILIQTNETDGVTSFISALNIVSPIIILDNIKILGIVDGGDYYDDFAGIFTFGAINNFSNIIMNVSTSVPSSPYDFNAAFFLDTPVSVYMENITSILFARGRIVGVYLGTPAKWGSSKEVILLNVTSIVFGKEGYCAFGLWVRHAKIASIIAKVRMYSNTTVTFGVVLTGVLHTGDLGIKIRLEKIIGLDYVVGLELEYCEYIHVDYIGVGKISSNLRDIVQPLYIKKCSNVIVSRIESVIEWPSPYLERKTLWFSMFTFISAMLILLSLRKSLNRLID